MFKNIQLLMAILVIIFAGYGLITGNHMLQPYSFLILSFLFLSTGIPKIRYNKKDFWGYLQILAATFLFLLAIVTFMS